MVGLTRPDSPRCPRRNLREHSRALAHATPPYFGVDAHSSDEARSIELTNRVSQAPRKRSLRRHCDDVPDAKRLRAAFGHRRPFVASAHVFEHHHDRTTAVDIETGRRRLSDCLCGAVVHGLGGRPVRSNLHDEPYLLRPKVRVAQSTLDDREWHGAILVAAAAGRGDEHDSSHQKQAHHGQILTPARSLASPRARNQTRRCRVIPECWPTRVLLSVCGQ